MNDRVDWEGVMSQVWASALAISGLELAAVLCGLAYVILAAREHIACWLFGLANAVLSIILFIEAGLYAESGLYGYYVAASVYGWYSWTYGKKEGATRKPVVEWAWRTHLALIAGSLVLAALLAILLQRYTDAQMPWPDALTTVFSFLATFLVTRKVLSNWVYWMVIDALSVWLYASRDLYLYALLMALYTILAWWGWRSWRQHYLQQEVHGSFFGKE